MDAHARLALLMLLVVYCHAQLYISPSGNSASKDCSAANPCSSVSQAVSVFNSTSASTFHLCVMSGSYSGNENYNVTLPADVPVVIERQNEQADRPLFQMPSGIVNAPFWWISANSTLRGLSLSNSLFNQYILGGVSSPGVHVVLQDCLLVNTALYLTSDSGTRLELLVVESSSLQNIISASGANAVVLRDCELPQSRLSVSDVGNVSWCNCHFSGAQSVTVSSEGLVEMSRVELTPSASSAIELTSGSDIRVVNCSAIGDKYTVPKLNLYGQSVSIEGSLIEYFDLSTNASLNLRNTTITNSECMNLEATVPSLISSDCIWNCSTLFPTSSMPPDQLSWTDCTFIDINSAYIQARSRGELTRCRFEDLNGSRFAITLTEGSWRLQDMVFNSSLVKSPYYAVIFEVPGGALEVDGCHFIGNPATMGAISFQKGSSLLVDNCLFERFTGLTLQTYATTNSIANSVFRHLYLESFGASPGHLNVRQPSVGASNTTIRSCIFQNCTCVASSDGYIFTGGCAVHVDNGTAAVYDSQFEDCNAVTYGSAVWMSSATVNLNNCSFASCSSPVVYVEQTSVASMSQLVFVNCSDDAVACGSATMDEVHLSDSRALTVDGTSKHPLRFVNNCSLYYDVLPLYVWLAFALMAALLVTLLIGAAGALWYRRRHPTEGMSATESDPLLLN